MTDDGRTYHLSGDEPFRIEYGGQCPVHLDKLFGPTIACEVRITLDRKSWEWVVERETITRNPDPRSDQWDIQGWEEVARFDCQESLNCGEDEP